MATQKKNNSSKIVRIPTDFAKSQNVQLSRDELRSKKKKQLKRRRAIRKAILSSAMVFIVALVGVVLSVTVFFKINTITVKGCKAYPQKIVLENCGVQEGDSLLLTSSKSIAENLISSLPYIGSVSITRELPSTLVINITDTSVAAAFQNKGAFILINDAGKVLDADANILGEGLPIVSGIEIESFQEGEIITFKTQESGDVLIELLKAVTESGMTGVTEIDLTNIDDIVMRYDNRIKILVGSSVKLKTKILRAASAIERENEINQYEVGVLNLKNDPNVYFKSGEEDTTTVETTKNNENKKKNSEKTNKTSEKTEE